MGIDLRWLAKLVHGGGRHRRAIGLVVTLLSVLCVSGIAAGEANARQKAPMVLGTAFKQHGSAAAVISDQRYAFAAPVLANAPGVLFDDLHHRRVTVSRPGCVLVGDAIVGGVLAFNCSNSVIPAPELYVIGSRSWRSVPLSSSIAYPCGPGMPCDTTSILTGAGSHWLKFLEDDCPDGEHCSFKNVFESIQTGAVAQDPARQGGDELADLDSPRLARRICSPLKIPSGFNIFTAPGASDLTLEGRFGLASSPTPQRETETYLEECGTHLHQLIESSTGASNSALVGRSAHEIVWQPPQLGLDIEFLPSLRRYRLRLGRAGDPIVSDLAVTGDRLYVIDQSNKLWVTPLPTRPPSS